MSFKGIITSLKMSINALLKQIGLELVTTRKKQYEIARLRKLKEQGHWLSPRYAEGLQFDKQKYLKFLQEVCLPYKSEYTSFQKKPEDGNDGFFLENGWFESIDAEILYSMIRHFRPHHIIEVGSGYSTRLMHKAIRDGKTETILTCIDPNPRVAIHDYADEHIRLPVEFIDPSRISYALRANDILFVDSSHIVTTGGDIPYLYLEVLPKLEEGVFIHIHDIFSPFDYPEEWVIELQRGWTEQYVVHAFLCYNNAFEIVWPAYYIWKYHKDEVLALIPSDKIKALPSSLWLRRIL